MPPITNWQHPLHVASKPTSADAAGSIWAIDVPTWITAIATVGLLAGAIITERSVVPDGPSRAR